MSRARKPSTKERMLNAPDKGQSKVSGIGGPLAALFRQVCHVRGIGTVRWQQLLDNYVRRIGRQSDSRSAITGARGNLTKALTNSELSWKAFCKGMQFAEVKRFKLTLEVEFTDGTKHTIESKDVEFEEGMEIDIDD